MNRMRITTAALLSAAVLGIGVAAPRDATAQSWPVKPVRLISTFSPGGTSDTLGRLVGHKLSEAFGQQFIVENKPGAGGAIGADFVARAEPDGYTLLISGVATQAIAPIVNNAAYDPIKDFTHIAIFGGPPVAVCVHPSTGVTDLKSLAALAKAKPLTFGSPGTGSHGHLVGELLKQALGIDMQHAPYKGASRAVADLVANHIPVTSTTLATAAPHVRAGKARALAISTRQRLPDFPDVPTFAELGYPHMVATTWFGLSGPPGLARDIVERLNVEVRKAMKADDLRQKIRPEGIEEEDMDVAQFNAFVKAEVDRWAKIVRDSGATNK